MKSIAVLLMTAGSALGSGTIVGLGVAPSGTGGMGVSANGEIVVGTAYDGQAEYAWRWTASTGLVPLASLPGNGATRANGLSADGAVAVGSAVSASGQRRPARWTGLGPGAIQDLGLLLGDTGGDATGVNGDGTIVIGMSGVTPDLHAFRWVALQGIEDLTTRTGGLVYPSVSADGLTYAGYTTYRAQRWTAAGGLEDLGTPDDPFASSSCVAVAAEGEMVIGTLDHSGPGWIDHQGFRWMRDEGMRTIGYFYPEGASQDGNVVVGVRDATVCSGCPYVTRAVVWTPALGLTSLQDFLPTRGVDLTGWELTATMGTSSDGRVLAGFGYHTVGAERRSEGWVVRLDGALPTCYANCDLSTAPPVLNVNDFACFLNRFAAADPYANCDGSTVAPALNVNDFTCFLNRFAAGCS